jgi:heptosyltransferase-2
MRVAILKPDHLGDLVLAAPAIAALRRSFMDVTLLCHPETQALAQHLFPNLALQPILFAHLDRTRCSSATVRPLREVCGRFDLIVSLRWDSAIRFQLQDIEVSCHVSERENLNIHVAIEQHDLIAPLTGHYDLFQSHRYADVNWAKPHRRPHSIGLCVAAGFPLNAWPLNHWLGLAERLARRGIEPVLIGGPQEATRLRVLADALCNSLGRAPRVLIGDQDFGRFLKFIAESVDLVIATDSGTAHLASLVRPVLSLFGGSPWRRFAPLGPRNAIVTRQLPCSPCPQFDRTLANTCQTRECLANLLPNHVEACLDAHLEERVTNYPRLVQGVWLTRAPWEHYKAGEESLAIAEAEVHSEGTLCHLGNNSRTAASYT